MYVFPWRVTDHKIFRNCILNFHEIPQEGTPIQNRSLEKFLTMISFLPFKAETITRKLNHIVKVSATWNCKHPYITVVTTV